jgi:hypothetical protein
VEEQDLKGAEARGIPYVMIDESWDLKLPGTGL